MEGYIYFTVEFYSNSWKGSLHAHETSEVKKAAFRDRSLLDRLPENERPIFDSLEFYRREGRIRLR